MPRASLPFMTRTAPVPRGTDDRAPPAVRRARPRASRHPHRRAAAFVRERQQHRSSVRPPQPSAACVFTGHGRRRSAQVPWPQPPCRQSRRIFTATGPRWRSRLSSFHVERSTSPASSSSESSPGHASAAETGQPCSMRSWRRCLSSSRRRPFVFGDSFTTGEARSVQRHMRWPSTVTTDANSCRHLPHRVPRGAGMVPQRGWYASSPLHGRPGRPRLLSSHVQPAVAPPPRGAFFTHAADAVSDHAATVHLEQPLVAHRAHAALHINTDVSRCGPGHAATLRKEY